MKGLPRVLEVRKPLIGPEVETGGRGVEAGDGLITEKTAVEQKEPRRGDIGRDTVEELNIRNCGRLNRIPTIASITNSQTTFGTGLRPPFSRSHGAKKEKTDTGAVVDLGVDEGADYRSSDPQWAAIRAPAGSVLEVCLTGCSVGFGTEDWFAVLVDRCTVATGGGLLVGGDLLGSENKSIYNEVLAILDTGSLHLCVEDPCHLTEEPDLIHCTHVRCWTVANFTAGYLTPGGRAMLALARMPPEVAAEPPGQKKPATTARRATPKPDAKRGAKKASLIGSPVIAVPSDGEDEAEGVEDEPVNREGLRSLLKATRERIAGSGGRRKAPAEVLSGGGVAGPSRSAPVESRLTAGTALRPGKSTSVALAPLEDVSGGEARKLKKRLEDPSDNTARLLAQAVQASEREAQLSKEKKKKKKSKDAVAKLAELLTSDKKKKKKKRKSRERHRKDGEDQGYERRVHFKPDPGDPGSSESSDYDSSSGSSKRRKRGAESDEDSELSFEAPLRRKALREPGSVMDMLVKNAQDQLDRGSLLESEGSQPGITSGIKISTFFALLIRPFYPNNSPLMRELYALGQTIDLLRSGRLPETADALASRFIAVHTALAEGGWATAAQLELYPLEPVQSASVGTMLQAQKHKRLLQKSQGIPPGRWGVPPGGKGRGAGQWTEKGKKGDNKGRGKGKTKGAGKDAPWPKKGDANPWKETQDEPGKK